LRVSNVDMLWDMACLLPASSAFSEHRRWSQNSWYRLTGYNTVCISTAT
jgi:hypothetical protein